MIVPTSKQIANAGIERIVITSERITIVVVESTTIIES
jgi:hypothetical protein